MIHRKIRHRYKQELCFTYVFYVIEVKNNKLKRGVLDGFRREIY